jgi:ABC-2 type transport system permease protein
MRTIYALWLRNIRDFTRNRVRLIISIIIPFFFVYVFSAIFKNDAIENPISYLLAGVIIATVFDSSLSVASSTIDDIVSGFMKEVLVSPTKRIYVAIGQLLSAATIASFQGILILLVGLLIGLKFTSFLTPILVIGTMMIAGISFAGLGLYIATTAKNTQTFQIIRTAITMPFTFLSGAYIPLAMLPKLLAYIAFINPMTYTTALFRTVILEKTNLSTTQLLAEGLAIDINGFIVTPIISLFVVIAFGIVFLILSTYSFISTDFSRIDRSNGKSDILE